MQSVTKTFLLAALAVATSGCQTFREHEATAGYVGDSALTARVRQALIKDPAIEASEVGVQTFEGEVTLIGVVDDEAMAQRVASLVEHTRGVRGIHNSLQIAPAPPTRTQLTASDR